MKMGEMQELLFRISVFPVSCWTIACLFYNTYRIIKTPLDCMAENNRLDFQFLGNSKLQTESTFSILCEGQPSQILQISVPPNCSNYIRGAILYSNSPNEAVPNFGTPFGLKYLFSKGINMYLWRNRTQQMQIVGLTHLRHKGPILILDLSVYKESLYVNLNHVMASKYTLENAIAIHPKLGTHQLIEFKDRAGSLEDFFKNNQKVALQATSPIIEKYLGQEEVFCLHSGDILALSQSIQAEKANNGVRLVGPGWVFFEPAVKSSNAKLRMGTIFFIFFIYGVILPLLFDYI